MVEYMNGITYFEAPNTVQAPSSLNEQYACIQSLKGWKVADGMGALVFGLQSGAEKRVAKCVRICDKSQSRCSSWTHAPCRCTPLVVVVVARNWVKWVAQNTAQRNATRPKTGLVLRRLRRRRRRRRQKSMNGDAASCKCIAVEGETWRQSSPGQTRPAQHSVAQHSPARNGVAQGGAVVPPCLWGMGAGGCGRTSIRSAMT